MDVHEKIGKLKEKIATGKTEARDIDLLNEIGKYIKELEERTKMTTEPALLENFEEMVPGNVVIQNVNIFVGTVPPPLE